MTHDSPEPHEDHFADRFHVETERPPAAQYWAGVAIVALLLIFIVVMTVVLT
jgi:hypothetical protein